MDVEKIINDYMGEIGPSTAMLLFGKTARIRSFLVKSFQKAKIFFATEYIEQAVPKLKESDVFCYDTFAQTMKGESEMIVIDQINELAGRYASQCFLGKSILAHLRLGHHVVLVGEGSMDDIEELIVFMKTHNLLTLHQWME